MEPERRAHARRSTQLEASADLGSVRAAGLCTDIGMGGAFLATPAAPVRGTPLAVSIRLPSGRALDLCGRVVRVEAGTQGRDAGLGIAWHPEACADALRSLARWLRDADTRTPGWVADVVAADTEGLTPGVVHPEAREVDPFPCALGMRYVMRERLGQGGNGVVYRALDARLDRPVVLKFMTPAAAAHALARRYFQREIRIAASLCHPGAVQVYHADTIDGVPYYVMEHVDAPPLSDRLKPGLPLGNRDVVLSVAAQLGAVLDHAHARGVLHRDVKPENVLFGDDGLLKLCDFGIARDGEGFGVDSMVVGTPYYMAPEQAAGVSVDRRADLYSYGVVLYRALAGRLPFVQGNLFVAHATEPMPDPRQFNPQLPDAVVPVLARLLAKRPDERYGRCADIVEALQHALYRPASHAWVPVALPAR